QGQFEEDGDALHAQRFGGQDSRSVEVSERRGQAVGEERQVGPRGAGEGAERVGLRRPVEVAERAGILVQVVLGPLVVGQRLRGQVGSVRSPGRILFVGACIHNSTSQLLTNDYRSGAVTTQVWPSCGRIKD